MKKSATKPDPRLLHALAVLLPEKATALAKPAPPPSPVSVYLQAKPAMAPNLRVVLRLLGETGTVFAFPWQDLRFEHVSAIRTLLAEQLAPAYARKCLVAVRGVLKVAWRMRAIDTDTYHRAVDVDSIKGDSAQAGRMLSPIEVRSMLIIPGDGEPEPADWRDSAIVALAVYGGLRREEISALDREHLNGSGVDVLGKGKKRRTVFLPEVAEVFFAQWRIVRGPEAGPLFWRGRRGGKLAPGRRLTPSGVWEVIVRRAAEAGVENVTPHDFRRTYASTLFDAGVDPVTVQHLMGHADLNTTSRYDRRGDERKKEAAQKLAHAFEAP